MFVPENFLAVAFDSGGVTTGPMTVPFIMALGVGIASIRNDKHAGDDSFRACGSVLHWTYFGSPDSGTFVPHGRQCCAGSGF